MRKIAIIIFLSILITGCLKDDNIKDTSFGEVSASPIVINEILPSTSMGMIELYNPSSDSVDLSGFTLSNSGSSFEIPAEVKMKGKSYYAILCDGQNKIDEFGQQHSNFTIRNNNSTVTLKDTENKLVEEVIVPIMDFGIAWGKHKSDEIYWDSFIPSPGEYNNPNLKVAVSDVSLNPNEPTNASKTTVCAKVASLTGIQSVVVYYEDNASSTTNFGVMAPSDTVYTYQIPKFITGTTVDYYIEITDIEGGSTRYPRNAPDSVFRYIVQNYGPYVRSIAAVPVKPAETESVKVTAIITDKVAIEKAYLVYIDPQGHAEITITMTNNGDIYSGVIPALPSGSMVYYYVKAKSAANITTFYPEDAPTNKLNYTVE